MNNPLQIKTIGITDSPELIDIEKPEQGLELHVGSNVFRNTNGVVKLQGKEQLVLETQPQPLALLLTMDLYDEQGTRVGHIRRNALSAHSVGRFTIHVKVSGEATPEEPPSVTVADRTTGHAVFEACFMQKRKIRINRGALLYSQRQFSHRQPTLLPHRHRSHPVWRCSGKPRRRGGNRIIGPHRPRLQFLPVRYPQL